MKRRPAINDLLRIMARLRAPNGCPWDREQDHRTLRWHAFEQVARHISDKLIRRHPHVFGRIKVKDVDEVWANWEKIKKAEKHGTRHARPSALDGIPKHLPSLLRAEKLVKKARRAKLASGPRRLKLSRAQLGKQLFELARYAQGRKWSAEDLLRGETRRRERAWRRRERRRPDKCYAPASRQPLKFI